MSHAPRDDWDPKIQVLFELPIVTQVVLITVQYGPQLLSGVVVFFKKNRSIVRIPGTEEPGGLQSTGLQRDTTEAT